MGSTGIQVLLILVLVGIGGYFAAAEIALISARTSALKRRAEEGSRGAKAAVQLLEEPTRLLSTIQIGITFVGFLAASVGAVALAKPVEEWFRSFNLPWLASVATGLGVLLVTLLISYVTLVFGELVPKRLGLQRAERVAIAVARPVLWLEGAFAPLVWLLSASTNAAARLIGLKGQGGRPGVSEEEIKLLVTEQGSLLDEEKRMIHEIFEIGDTVVREVMVPRVDMALVEDTETVSQATSIMQGTGYSRLPVYHEDRDRIVGITLLKDLVGPLAEGDGREPIIEHMREPVFVPETKGILPLLSEMRATRNQIVIVVDEYGGTAGLVTMEDIVEEIVGEIADEFDRDHRYIQQAGPHEWVVDGRFSIEDAIERRMPVEESDEYETVAGWLLAELGHIPVSGERYEHNGWEFRVQTMRRRRVSRIRVTERVDVAAADATKKHE
ncbi:MAG: HlyC/CorC family transporter [Coriobacteriia bacterium]|nr:HlyC/CorC family transporter [Coriobacteriia bacterium]